MLGVVMHIHKWDRWEIYAYPVKRTYRGQVFDGVEEIQQKQCVKCGLRKTKQL